MKTNYHTHTYLCKHASGDVYDYVEEAIKQGFDILGMSDHGWVPYYTFYRMDLDQFENIYLKQIEDCKEKYKGKIKILSSLEVEYFEGIDEVYENYLKKLDYLVLGQHNYSCDKSLKSTYELTTKEGLIEYRDTLCKAIRSGFFKILAHPDLFLCAYPKWDKDCEEVMTEVIKTAVECNVYIEVNAQGIRREERTNRYPNEELFKIVKRLGGKVVVDSDCHWPTALYDESYKKAKEFAEKLGLDVVDEIEL